MSRKKNSPWWQDNHKKENTPWWQQDDHKKEDTPWWQDSHVGDEDVENLPPPPEPLRRVRQVGRLKPELETDPEKILEHLRHGHHPPDFFSCCKQSYIVADYYKNRKLVEDKARQLLIDGEVDYIWRTRNDERVCPECRQHEGKVYSLLSPPPEGHPGTKPGCRCEMEVIKGESKPKNQAGKPPDLGFTSPSGLC